MIYHGRFGRFETNVFEVFFLRAQRGTVIHNVRVVTMNFVHNSFVTTTYQNPYTEHPGVLSDGTCTSIPAMPIFKTGPISWSASIDAYGLESFRFLWVLCILCTLTCGFSIRHHQE